MEQPRIMGALRGKIDVRDYKIDRKLAMAVQYPDTFELSELPPVKNQGSIGSCVAHAVSEILEFHYRAGTKLKLSTNFIYGIHYKLFGTKGPGMYLRDACKIVKDYGDPKEEYCRGNTEVDRVYDIANTSFANELIMDNAKQYRITSYAKVKSDNDIKYALMNHGPVLAAIKWYSKNTASRSTGLLVKNGTYNGSHAIMIYGWNEIGWLCQNSWGTTWGKLGLFILPYDYDIDEAYCLVSGELPDDIDIPDRTKFLNFIYKVINYVINLGVDLYYAFMNFVDKFRKK